MAFLLGIVLLAAIIIGPVMFAARVVEARHSGFFPALVCVVGLAALSAGIDSLVGFEPLAMLISALGGAALFAGSQLADW